MGRKRLVPTDYTKIYNYFYEKFAKQKKYEISDQTKADIIDMIFNDISFSEQIAIKSVIRFKSYVNGYDAASKSTGIPKSTLMKQFETATKHMYSPKNIGTAVNGYYYVRGAETILTKMDFSGKQYIVTALERAGIRSREQLFKHLNNGWYYLWTIPGCGDGARQKILMAIDKWKLDGWRVKV